MIGKKHILLLAAALFCAVLCTGCVGQPADSLYALPKQPDEYYELQNAIDQVMVSGAAYSGPLTGSNQQAVQLADLDGDHEDEAIVFVKVGGSKALKAYIFDNGPDGTHQNTAVIEGDGSAFDAVDYIQMDGEPGLEIIRVGILACNPDLAAVTIPALVKQIEINRWSERKDYA